MKTAPAAKAPPRRTRDAAVTIEDPRITVVESPNEADPGAIQDALELLVKWAVRAHRSGKSGPARAATVESCSTYGPEN